MSTSEEEIDKFTGLPAEDPTYVELDEVQPHQDPFLVHETGITNHKGYRIDCPYISEIAPNLYRGGTDQRLVLPELIDYYLTLYPWGSYIIRHQLKEHEIVTMYDSLDQGLDDILNWAKWVHDRRSRGNVLVTCQAGLNRSGIITATALVLDGYTPQEAIDLLRTKRSPAVLCNQAFEDFILDLKLW
jgi:protein-tyrosine phosphatase